MKTFKLLLFLCAVIINFTACETQETNTLPEEEQKSWETKVQNYLPFIYNNYTIGDSLIFVTVTPPFCVLNSSAFLNTLLCGTLYTRTVMLRF